MFHGLPGAGSAPRVWLRAHVHAQAMVSVHTACPFGSSSAVYSWERVGAMLATLAVRVLHLATLRYVDDFFAPERCSVLRGGPVACACPHPLGSGLRQCNTQ